MKADQIKVKVKLNLKIQILNAGLEINVNKKRVKIKSHFLNLRIIKKCSVLDLAAAIWKVFSIALKILSFLRFLYHS